MQDYIAVLIKKGFAYESAESVYFDVRKFKKYGELSHQNLDQIRSNVRIEKDEKKKDALDFALWKKAKEGEPSWNSPWGKGRPGWHIECSVMSSKILGDEFDIHGGGIDLIFPHHENEIAQSQAYSGKGFARIWMHNGLLTINQQKMAKSLGNFISVKDFLKKYHSDVLKLFFLQTHYSQPIDFTWERMKEKQKALKKIISFLELVERRREGMQYVTSPNLKAISPKELHEKIKEGRENFEKSMDDDFNTPNAVAVLFEIILECNKVSYSDGFTKEHLKALKYAKDTIKELGNVFGISFDLGPSSLTKKEKEEIEQMRDLRNDFRMKRMFKEADQIRKKLEKKVILEDTKDGKTIWREKI
jgi:cysteinyl-tRNA synthetase